MENQATYSVQGGGQEEQVEKRIGMDEIMSANLGGNLTKIKATFRKTVNIRQYETEVIELETELEIDDKELTSIERMLITEILQAQLEYNAYVNLVYKKYVTSTEFEERRTQLAASVNSLKKKAEKLLGREIKEGII